MSQAFEYNNQTKGLIRLTMACNERCPFCNVPMEDYERLTPSEDEIDAQLQLFIETGERTLTISGGEPTLLRKRLLSLIRKARLGGISFVELQSNAILIDEGYARSLRDAGLTSAFISLLSETPELHDELAGLKGAFERCVNGIQALLAQGIAVTLNPVLARQSQARLVEYIHFVHRMFPAIQTISLSAVQPHGRARENIELLPDYAQLAALVPAAIATAKSYGIKLVNPYCGLPVCIGWSAQAESCVEVIERQSRMQQKPNIQNRGNKSKRGPCHWCVYRTACGGAWHAYWEHRAGSGIKAPVEMVPPWVSVVDSGYQQVRIAGDLAGLEGLPASDAPSVWVVLSALEAAQIPRLMRMRFSDIVWRFDPTGMALNLSAFRESIRTMKKLHRRLLLWDRRLHVLCDARKGTLEDQKTLLQLCDTLHVNVKIAASLPPEMCY